MSWATRAQCVKRYAIKRGRGYQGCAFGRFQGWDLGKVEHVGVLVAKRRSRWGLVVCAQLFCGELPPQRPSGSR